MPDDTTVDQPAAPAEQPHHRTPPHAKRAGDGRKESVVMQILHRSGAEAQELLEALGMREKLSGEAKDLARLIERKLAYSVPTDREEALDQLEIQRAYLAHRFIGPMKSFERADRFYSYLDTFLNFASILAGVGAALAAALSDAPKMWWVIALGLLVGFLQSLSQWLKPSRRSTRRGLAAAALRSEAWAFLQTRERYRGKDDRAAWTLFCDQVDKVQAREETDEDKERSQVPPAHAVPAR